MSEMPEEHMAQPEAEPQAMVVADRDGIIRGEFRGAPHFRLFGRRRNRNDTRTHRSRGRTR